MVKKMTFITLFVKVSKRSSRYHKILLTNGKMNDEQLGTLMVELK